MANSLEQERGKMLRGESFFAGHPGLVKERQRTHQACHRYNNAGDVSRRRAVEMWREVGLPKLIYQLYKTSIRNDLTPLPPPSPEVDDDILLANEPYIEAPFYTDYGYNIHLGEQVYTNFNCTILDSCAVHIGSRTLLGPNVSLYTATHTTDPAVRNGLKGPEFGKEIHIGEDCWFGGSVVVLPGVTIGNGSTIGAGSVVTKDIPPYSVAAGNPARVIRSLPQPTTVETEAAAPTPDLGT
ncbi:MAG: hypothetical protein M1839_001906 [Geoglossum umbratile]|nr:MAG: hypothetical protein M1839_001906 [Geoglossum umbratile]